MKITLAYSEQPFCTST